MQVSLGNDVTRAYVHHGPKTDTINLHYSNQTRLLDSVGIVSGSKRPKHVKVVDAATKPYLFRMLPPSRSATHISLGEARRLSSGLDNLCLWRERVESVRGDPDADWQQFLVSQPVLTHEHF
jgi:hypothetical protein